MRLAIYSDFAYRRDGDQLWAELSVVVFLAELRRWLDAVTLVGRLDPQPGRWAYPVPPGIEFAGLTHYPSLARPVEAAGALIGSVRGFWRVLDRVDGVWLLGPHPFAIVFAVLAWARRRRVVLGVRQDLPAYVANRRPGRRRLRAAALVLEGAWRLLGRVFPVVVVGPDLARRYGSARELLSVSISLVSAADVEGPEVLEERDYGGELRILSVGRLDAEKNPLLLADVLAALRAHDRRWKLTVCGEGALAEELSCRLEQLAVAEHAELRGFVSLDRELPQLYRSSHLLLHCSWTEGVPQVLLEASAARLPIVATAVGGVAEAAEGAAILIPAGDAEAAAQALLRLAEDGELRRSLTEVAAARAREHSLEAEARRVARFVLGAPREADGAGRPAS